MTRSSSGLVAMVLVITLPGSLAADVTKNIEETTAEQVRNCRPMGQIVGEYWTCIKSKAKADARRQASALGASHIVFVNLKCVVGAGEKAEARIFDCSPGPPLDDTYEDYLASDPALEKKTVASTSPAKVMTSRDLDADSADLTNRGYVPIGYAGVSGGKVPLETVREKAAAVGAELALIRSIVAGEDVEYQTVTSYARGGASIGISSGAATANVGHAPVTVTGSGTNITSSPGGSNTQVVPYAQRRFETQVLFWRKLKPGPLGLILSSIPPELRAKYSRNTGAFVVGVDDESPAFFANLLPGDVIVTFNGTDVRTPAELAAFVEQDSSASVTLGVFRNLQTTEVRVTK